MPTMQEKIRIGVVIGSIREGRFGDKPAHWIADLLSNKEDVEVELLDLKDYPLLMFAEAVSPSKVLGAYGKPDIDRWAEKIANTDGFVFVTPEYNHGYPASLKNNIDHLKKEWNKKPSAFVGYGTYGAVRAVEQLRQVVIDVGLVPLKSAVHIVSPWDLLEANGSLKEKAFAPNEGSADRLIEELIWWAQLLKNARNTV